MIVLSVRSSSSSPVTAVFSVALFLLYISETALGAPCPINGESRVFFSPLLTIRLLRFTTRILCSECRFPLVYLCISCIEMIESEVTPRFEIVFLDVLVESNGRKCGELAIDLV